jgi:hypothetical protein
MKLFGWGKQGPAAVSPSLNNQGDTLGGPTVAVWILANRHGEIVARIREQS